MVEIDQYAVMGNPISHSKSPIIHRKFAQATNQLIDYQAILVKEHNFYAAVTAFQAAGGKGLNITVPFKGDAYNIATIRSERAQRAGAVNTLKFSNGEIYGDNTDGIGLLRDLTNNLGISVRGKRLLILGAGGATHGILAPLLNAEPQQVVIANRTAERAVKLANDFANLGKIVGGGFNDLTNEQFEIIINATSASIDDQIPPLPTTIFANGACCYDLMYAAAPTAFLNWCLNNSAAKIADGLGMLVEQAAEAFFLWRGVRPNTKHVINELTSWI